MKGNTFKLIIREGLVYLTPDQALNLRDVGYKVMMGKQPPKPVYWMLGVKGYSRDTQTISCSVITYGHNDFSFPPEQQSYFPQLKEIRKIEIVGISTSLLLNSLPGVVEYFEDEPEGGYSFENYMPPPVELGFPIHTMIKNTVVPMQKAEFVDGGVQVEFKLEGVFKRVVVKVPNPFVKKEFQTIKGYIARVLGTRRLNFTINYSYRREKLVDCIGTSPEVDKITEALFEEIAFEAARTIPGRRTTPEDPPGLITFDELMEITTLEKSYLNLIYKSEQNFIEKVLSVSNTKHFNQLQFLSKRHANDILRLRFVLSPFSFVFLIPGNLHNYIVWETLDTSEATYVWRIPKEPNSLAGSLQRINRYIEQIKMSTKTAYLRESGEDFLRVFHEYSEAIEGFRVWKEAIERVLNN